MHGYAITGVKYALVWACKVCTYQQIPLGVPATLRDGANGLGILRCGHTDIFQLATVSN